MTERVYSKLALLRLLSVTFYFWLQDMSIRYAKAGISVLMVVGFILITTGLASPFILGEKMFLMRALGVSSGFVGVAFITV